MNREISKGDVYRKYVFDEMAKTTTLSIKDLEKYVDSLSDDKAKELCRHLSHSRKNQVYRFISNGPDCWIVKTVNISKIYMGGINKKANRYFIRNAWLLKRIAKDKGVRRYREFHKRGDIHIRSLSLIADRVARGKYKIVDGNHRAVKLSFDGKKEFELIFY